MIHGRIGVSQHVLKFQIRQATPGDLSKLRNLLNQCSLPADDIRDPNHSFWLAETDGTLVAAVGLEKHGEYGLFRSLCVTPDLRAHGLGKRMSEFLLERAQEQAITQLYLLTTTAKAFFRDQGFVVCPRDKAPEVIRQTVSFSQLCPQSAVVMSRRV